MKDSKVNHIANRCIWLTEIIQARKLSNASHRRALETMRAFASLAVDDRFHRVSYNTLKQHAKSSHPLDNPAHASYWSLMLALREEANEIINAPTPKNQDLTNSNELLVKQSLLHAHLCSTAYLEIFNHLEQLVAHDPSLSEQTQFTVTKFLNQARIKYSQIINSELPTSASQLKLIAGGKRK